MNSLPTTGPVFESFWRFAAKRQDIYLRRLASQPAPWTSDEVLTQYRFTNVFRASDRVSQFLISNVLADGELSEPETAFRVLLFKIFNKIETWQLLRAELGQIELRTFDLDLANEILTDARSRGRPVYSGAYIVPPVPGWPAPKHLGHLHLAMDLATEVRNTGSLEELFRFLVRAPGLGQFLAFQFAIDLGYSEVFVHDEDEFVVAGPGALDGLSKVFPGMDLRTAPAVIARLVDQQEAWFERFGLEFGGLFGRRLHKIDVQNLMCEISKYSRVAHPEVQGVAGRARIKQNFATAGPLARPEFPVRWGLNTSACNYRHHEQPGQLALI